MKETLIEEIVGVVYPNTKPEDIIVHNGEGDQTLFMSGRIVRKGSLLFRVMLYNENVHIVIPKQIREWIIIGWPGCADCKRLAEWIPEMDHITLDEGFLSAKAKLIMQKIEPDGPLRDFPVMLSKDGTSIIHADEISEIFGFAINTEGVVL